MGCQFVQSSMRTCLNRFHDKCALLSCWAAFARVFRYSFFRHFFVSSVAAGWWPNEWRSQMRFTAVFLSPLNATDDIPIRDKCAKHQPTPLTLSFNPLFLLIQFCKVLIYKGGLYLKDILISHWAGVGILKKTTQGGESADSFKEWGIKYLKRMSCKFATSLLSSPLRFIDF